MYNCTNIVVVPGSLPAADPVPDQHRPGRARSERERGGEDAQRLQHHRPPASVTAGRTAEADGQPAAQCGPAGSATAATTATTNSDNLQQPTTKQLGLLEKRN